MDKNLPAGWYTSSDGSMHYWTGSEWITPAEPAAQAPQVDDGDDLESPMSDGMAPPPPARRKHRTRLVALTVTGIVLIGVLTGGAFYVKHVNDEALAREKAEQAAAASEAARQERIEEEQAEAEREREEEEAEQRRVQEALQREAEEEAEFNRQLDEQFTSGEVGKVFDVIESGSLYFRYLDDDEFSCGYWGCTGVQVYSVDGCPGGVYVEASVLENGVVVGRANLWTGALRADETGGGLLETTYQGSNVSFRLEEVTCH